MEFTFFFFSGTTNKNANIHLLFCSWILKNNFHAQHNYINHTLTHTTSFARLIETSLTRFLKFQMTTEQTKFSVLCSLFTWTQRSKSTAKKRSKFRKFLDAFCIDRNFFPAVRLILPNLDRERGSYGLKESVLATSLIDALGISRDSPDALRLVNWRKGGAATGATAGNFALVAAEVGTRHRFVCIRVL